MSSTSAHTTAYEAVQKGSGQSDSCLHGRPSLAKSNKRVMSNDNDRPLQSMHGFQPFFRDPLRGSKLNHAAALFSFFLNAQNLCCQLSISNVRFYFSTFSRLRTSALYRPRTHISQDLVPQSHCVFFLARALSHPENIGRRT
jgi:hypothetical protein